MNMVKLSTLRCADSSQNDLPFMMLVSQVNTVNRMNRARLMTFEQLTLPGRLNHRRANHMDTRMSRDCLDCY